MTAAPFIPPFPEPRESLPGAFEMIRLLRGNILSGFLARSYQAECIPLHLLGRRMIIVNTPELVRDIFVLRHDVYGRKSHFMERALAPVIGESLFINHGEVWRERRDALAPALHPAGLPQFHPLFMQVASEVAAEWEVAAGGPPRDIAPDLAIATARIVMLAVFGPEVARAASCDLAAAFAIYQDAVESIDLAHLLGLPAWVPTPQSRRARRAARDIRALIEALLQRHALTAPFAGFAAVRRDDGGAVLDQAALVDEIAMMLLAGSETSANALAWAFYLAASHAPTLNRLRAEWQAVLGDGRAPEAADLPALVFTRAVVQETLRLYPPVAILSRQAMRADRIRRWEISKGSTVACLPWLLQRNALVWHAPHEFRPERFLPDAPEKPQRFAHIPFGLGPRVCAGAAFGMAEMMVFLPILLRRLDFTIAPQHRVMPKLRLTLRPDGGLPMLMARRATHA
ncbi:MAG: cytochrome P450 [Roseomonas sp.]